MAIEVKRKDNESFPSLLRRFTRRVKASRVLAEARARRFSKRKPTKRHKRLSALHRETMKRMHDREKKLSKPNQASDRKRYSR